MVSFVGSAKGTNTATAPSHAVGDIMVVCATRNASATAPSLVSGWTNLGTSTSNTNSIRLAWRYAASTSDATGTWTNATECIVTIYRPTAGNAGGIGGFLISAGSSATASYGGITMFDTSGNSWIAAFGQTKTQSVGISTAPATFANTNGQDELGTGELASFDTNGGVSSSSTHTVSITSGVWKTAVVEILDVAPSAASSNIVQHIAYGYAISLNSPNNLLVYSFDPTLAGNGIVFAVAYPSGLTPAITDDKGNTWPASGAAGTVTSDAGAGNMALQIFRLASATTGTSQITVSFGTGTGVPVKAWYTQLFNITGTVNSTSAWHAQSVNALGVVSPGAQTPTNNDANGGNLILSYCCDSAIASTTNPQRFIAAPGYGLNDADISWTNGQGAFGLPAASQFLLQTAAASTTPKFQIEGSGVDTYNVAAIALSVGTQGTAKPSGAGVAPWIDRICYFITNTSVTGDYVVQIPSSGNCGLFSSPVLTPTSTPKWNSVTDSDGTSWTLENPVSGGSTAYININQTPSLARWARVSITGANGVIQIVYYDISNCDPSPVVATAGVGSTVENNVSSVSSQPSITPTATNQLTIACGEVGIGPSTSVSAPTGAVFDFPSVQVWKGTGAIATTTLTVATTTWGAVPGLGTPPILSGSGVTAGTTVQSGTGPTYTIQPSQNVGAGTTLFMSGDDGMAFAFGNYAGHYFNGSNVSAQTWSWSIPNNPSNSTFSFAIILKGPAGAAFLAPRPYTILQAVKRGSYI